MTGRTRNWAAQITSWALSFSVFELIGPGTMLAVLLRSLGASSLQIGFLLALLPIGMAVQALGAPVLEARRSRKWALVAVTAASSAPYLLMAVGVWGLADAPKGWSIAVVIGCFALIALSCGVREVAFFELAGATVAERRRGRFFGLRDAVTAATGMLGGAAVAWTLSRYEDRFPMGFVVFLVGGFVAVTLAWAALSLADDRPRSRRNGPARPLDLLKRLPAMLREDRRLTRYLVWRTFIQAARSAHAFLIVFALARFGLGDGTAGYFLVMVGLSRLIAGLPCGWITDRWGPGTGIVIVSLLSVILTTTAVAVAGLDLHLGVAYCIFAILGVFRAMWFSADSAMVLKLTSPELHLRYVSVARLVPLPATLAAPIVMGLVAGRWGYCWTFALGSLLAVGAVIVAAGLSGTGEGVTSRRITPG